MRGALSLTSKTAGLGSTCVSLVSKRAIEKASRGFPGMRQGQGHLESLRFREGNDRRGPGGSSHSHAQALP